MNKGEELYSLYSGGDDKAFEQIVKEYRDMLTLFINRYVRNIDTAEDIAIDVFTYLLTHKHAYNFKVSLKTYLFMLGRSRAIDYLRKNKKINIRSFSEENAENDISDGKTPESQIIENHTREAVNAAVEALPEAMRSAVYLVYFEELSYEDAARVMKKSKKQLDNLLYRAKALLREKLEGER